MKQRPARHLADVHGVARGAASSAWRSHRRVSAAAPERVTAGLEAAPADVPWAELTRAAKLRSRVKLLTTAVLAWAWNYLKYVLRSRHEFLTYEKLEKRRRSDRPGESGGDRRGLIEMQEGSTVALAGDWGSGTRSAYRVADKIRRLKPDYTIHLGDVYYSGTGQEFDDYFLPEAAWPGGAKGSFALNGNHEMYSGGRAYFGAVRDESGQARLTHQVDGRRVPQEVSYFCLQNDHWRILALDTGYYAKSFPILELFDTHFIKLHRAIRTWLRDTVFADRNDRRPVILLTHHEWFSAYDSEYRRMGKQMLPYLDRVLIWFWGHEHRFSGYAPFGFDGGPTVRARCIGHGGIPFDIAYPHRNRQLVFSDERIDCESTNQINAKQQLGFCGFAFLRFQGATLSVAYYDEGEDSSPLLEERWSRDEPSGAYRGSVEGGVALAKYVDGPAGRSPRRVCGEQEGRRRLADLGGVWMLPAG